MKSIAIFNNKGGVGKTTFLSNLAAYLTLRLNKKVLVVDADPQCNATMYCMQEDFIEKHYSLDKRETIETFFEPIRRAQGYLQTKFRPQKSPRFGFSLIPGDPKLALSEDILASDWGDMLSGKPRGMQTSFVFKDMLLKFSNYDYIFFDVSPSLGAINRAVLIASDFFVMPMSSDIFSVMAVSNIAHALKEWKRDLRKGLDEYKEKNNEDYKMSPSGTIVDWNLKFAGYVTQQYTAKRVQGTRQPVRAYENVITKAPSLIKTKLVEQFSGNIPGPFKLSDIPNLHSVVPLSQSSHSPIFALKAADGVVGAHFAKVRDTERLYQQISGQLLANIGA